MKRVALALTVPCALAPASTQAQKAYIANSVDNTVSVIDTATNTVIGSPIPVGPFPLGVAVTPDGSTVYVTNHHSNMVSVIDTVTDTVSGSPIPVGVFPFGVAVTPDGGKGYVANEKYFNLTGAVSATDTTTSTLNPTPTARPLPP